jgi:hypothetical protein
MPRLIISNEDKLDYIQDLITPQQLFAACLEEGFIDEIHLQKMMNSMATAMFSVWRELGMPDEIFDCIVKGDSKALQEAIAYLKADNVSDKERALKANVLNWTINTVGIGYQLGAIFQRDDKTPGEEAPMIKG